MMLDISGFLVSDQVLGRIAAIFVALLSSLFSGFFTNLFPAG